MPHPPFNRRQFGMSFLVPLLLLSLAGAQSAFVRFNQLGYEGRAPKRAYLIAPGKAAGATFEVLNARRAVVYRAAVGNRFGHWGRYTVAALDFDPVTQEGAYTIVVQGRYPAISGPILVGPASRLYQPASGHALQYFRTVRDGPDFYRSALRTAAGHLHDLHAQVFERPHFDRRNRLQGELQATGLAMDVAGGWWDAGDYLKFVETTSYSVAMLLVGDRDFPAQMGARSGPADFSGEAKFGLDWLFKMWDDPHRTLYYQVGLGAGNGSVVGDHDLFRLPQADDTMGGADPTFRYIRQRPVFRSGPPGSPISPNLAGRLAADFALGAQVFRTTDPAYARRCLEAAEHVYDLAETAPAGRLLTTSPFRFYDEHQWRDDLELGATELARALRNTPSTTGLPHTDPQFYLRQAAHWAHLYIHDSRRGPDTLSLDNVAGLAHFELYRAMKAADRLETTHAELLADLREELDEAEKEARRDPFGFGVRWASNDPVSHGVGLCIMADEYATLTAKLRYHTLASRWLGNILGANAWGASFIIGDGAVFPNCPQHQVANLAGSHDGSPPRLLGAAVEGPNRDSRGDGLQGMRHCDASARFAPFNARGAVYSDRVQSYSTNEPAIDLTAATPLAFAWQMAQPDAE